MITLINPSNFRQCLILSVLCERAIEIKELNDGEETPGIKESQMKIIKLIQQMTNGSKVEVSKDGRQIRFFPGIISNNQGRILVFCCGQERSIGYYLEVAMTLAIFGKYVLDMQMTGITNDNIDVSVDSLLSAGAGLWRLFGGEVQGKVVKRGFRGEETPEGLVEVKVNTIKWLDSIDLSGEQVGIRRIRGVVYGGKISAQLLNRVVSSAKSILLPFCQDVWLKTDYDRKSQVSGYGVQMEAQQVLPSVLSLSVDQFHEKDESPEEIGQKIAHRLLDEVIHQRHIDSSLQSNLFLFMALSQKKISKVDVGRLTHYSIATLRLLDQFLGVKFIVQQKDSSLITLSCFGIGLNNISRIVN